MATIQFEPSGRRPSVCTFPPREIIALSTPSEAMAWMAYLAAQPLATLAKDSSGPVGRVSRLVSVSLILVTRTLSKPTLFSRLVISASLGTRYCPSIKPQAFTSGYTVKSSAPPERSYTVSATESISDICPVMDVPEPEAWFMLYTAEPSRSGSSMRSRALITFWAAVSPASPLLPYAVRLITVSMANICAS